MAKISNLTFYQSPMGWLQIADDDTFITGISLINEPKENQLPSPLGRLATKELTEYFNGRRQNFTLPINPQGTEFQKNVWQQLRQIPYGQTASYKDIAQAIGNPKACRAVGMANNKNPILIVIPCHRVIGADGSLVGFGGGLPAKKFLLNLEKTAPVTAEPPIFSQKNNPA